MQNLLQLFARYGSFIVFVLLEVICLYLIINYNKQQKEIYLNSSNILSGWITERTDQIARFWNLSEISDSLAMDNARLRTLLDKATFENLPTTDTIVDTVYTQEYMYTPARVVGNSIILWDNHLTINKGSKDGIRQGMGLITERGVVGIVSNVTEDFAQCVSILNGKVRVSATHKKSGQFGTLLWRGEDPRKITLKDVPKYAEIEIGDSIVTNRFSSIFPDGISVGTIDTFWVERGTNFYNIELNLTEDISKIRYVYVVHYLFKNQQLEAEGIVEDE